MLKLIPKPPNAPRATRFRDLRVRPKLIVLHNAFFLLLAGAVYYSLIPLVEEHVANVQRREAAILGELFLVEGRATQAGGIAPQERRFGSAEQLQIPEAIRRRLDERPGETHWDAAAPNRLYRKDPQTESYGELRFDEDFHQGVVRRAKTTLFLALGAIYVLAVLALELFILPRYVYRPIDATLRADQAVQQGERAEELITALDIPGDEVGDIMRSRNQTVTSLREKEAALEHSLGRSEELAADLRRENEELESAKRGMAGKDRLATIGLLSASVARELNTPLSVIRGTVERLLETVEDPRERSRLERVRRMAERLRRIGEGLLDFTRAPRSERREKVLLREVVDEAWSLLALDERASGVRFSNAVDAPAAAVGDYDRLMQVFVNVIKNGLFALDGRGSITVRSASEQEQGREWVSIQVEDTGPGIPEDVLPNIFEAFVSSRLDSEGNGLGLTVADGIVQHHGGRIAATNRPEGGARLTVRLPAA